jgi:hypothetical protein
MLIRLCEMRWRQHRNRPPVLVGKVADFWLMLVGRHKPIDGQPDFTLFISPRPVTTDAKPTLPPIWDAEKARWIGPDNPDYPDFYDDFKEAVADLEGR